MGKWRNSHHPTLVRAAIDEAFLCHYCNEHVPLPVATKDHIVPKAYGGSGFFWNIVYACRDCNHGFGHTYMKCDCSKCSSARLRWELEDMDVATILRIKPQHRLEVMLIREAARERHGHPAEVWTGVYMM